MIDKDLPFSAQIGMLKNRLIDVRNELNNIAHGNPARKEILSDASGGITCAVVTLYHEQEKAKEAEIRIDDRERGESVSFHARGIGSDHCPCCFVCGEGSGLMANLAAFVSTKADGEKVVEWFGGRARLDYRPSEPDWIQVKVGACPLHDVGLKSLERRTRWHNRIRKADIMDTISLAQQVTVKE